MRDPISERERALKAEITALEARIKKLSREVEHPRPARPTPAEQAVAPQQRHGREPIFERVDQNPIQEAPRAASQRHFNELGLRKYDLSGFIQRVKKRFCGPPVPNPKLVSYLAAGSVQGLRSLRFEKRIARARFLAWSVLLAIVVFGILAAVLH
jgi:hypothetical protein